MSKCYSQDMVSLIQPLRLPNDGVLRTALEGVKQTLGTFDNHRR